MSGAETNTAPDAATGLTYALVGNPNCGKTTLFNSLTGLRQRVGNYPGVTVERKEGEFFSQHGQKIKIIDLPGAYSLNARSPDEAVLRDVLLGRQPGAARPDRIVCVADASNLERNLYLISQILELGIPVIVALNMVDVAEERGLRIDVPGLSAALGVPVIPIVASSKKGLVELKSAMSKAQMAAPHALAIKMPEGLQSALEEARDTLAASGALSQSASLLEPLYLLSGHDPTQQGIRQEDVAKLSACRATIDAAVPQWEDKLVAARYDKIGELCEKVVRHPERSGASLTDKLDGVFLHRFWGWVSLIAILGLLFYVIFSLAEAPMNWIETIFGALGQWVQGLMPAGDLRDLIIDGAITGVSSVLIFLPQILILFFFIGLMEDTGYMARVAFIMDRLMGKVGLNGKSFLPLLSSHACAVPGIMATRTIESPKDRLITILVAPLASCSARLPVYLLLIAALLPSDLVPWYHKAGLLLLMYVLGIAGAFGFAWLFNRTLMKGATSPLILELPSYKVPALKGVLLHMWERTWLFVRRAGTVILALVILLWAAATYPKSGSEDKSTQLEQSYAGRMGKFIEPAIKPLGYDWKIGIGLVSSFAAREVFVSTMAVVYAVEEEDEEAAATLLRDKIRAEKWEDGRPVYTPVVCLSLMVFYVFAMQCISTVAVVRRETNTWKWPLFQLAYMTAAAYIFALLVYQIGSRI